MIFILNVVGKYFLVDAGYTNDPGFLAPCWGTRYHLNEWIGNTPQSYKESFNICHESAWNAIERSFGILKKRWSILRTLSFFDIKTQISIINACFALHNFIRGEQQADQLLEVQDFEFLSIVDEELVHQSREGVENNVTDDITTIQAIENWTRLRDTLAMNMFANYQVKETLLRFFFICNLLLQTNFVYFVTIVLRYWRETFMYFVIA